MGLVIIDGGRTGLSPTLWDRDPSSNKHWPVGPRQGQCLFKPTSSLFSLAGNSFHTHHLSTPTVFPHLPKPSTMPSPPKPSFNCAPKLARIIEWVIRKKGSGYEEFRAPLESFQSILYNIEVPFFLPCEGKLLAYAYLALKAQE